MRHVKNIVKLTVILIILSMVCTRPQSGRCYQPFRWEDCGVKAEMGFYYYMAGTRCEIGAWRGCLPNPNFFLTEFDCVQDCIFNITPYKYEKRGNFDRLDKVL